MADDSEQSSAHDKRRQQMLQAAVEVICERGFSDTRISDVAKRTKSSPALVIYYFGTKDGLLTEAMRYSDGLFYDATEARLGELTTAREKLELLVRVTCVKQGHDELPGAWGLWFDLWAQAFRHPEVAKDRAAMDRRWERTIATVVEEGQRRGELVDVDVDEFVVAFAAMLDGLAIQVALEDEVVDSDRAFAVAMRFASGYLGFQWPGSPTPTRSRAAARTDRKSARV